MNKIDTFDGEYKFLSNFWPLKKPIRKFNLNFWTVEGAYQAAKTRNKKQQKQIADAKSPGEAKRLGQKVDLIPTREKDKTIVMASLVFEKFASDPELKEKLLATGDADLIEGNTWGDTFWGICKGEGKNYLGQILMNVRHAAQVGLF